MTKSIIGNQENPHERYAYPEKGEEFERYCPTEKNKTRQRYEGQLVAVDEEMPGIDLVPHMRQGLYTCLTCKTTLSATNRTEVQIREIQEARKAA